MDLMIEVNRIPERAMEKNEKPVNSLVMNQMADPMLKKATEPISIIIRGQNVARRINRSRLETWSTTSNLSIEGLKT
jgi:hypothetical protein